MKVALIQRIVPHYRVEIFKRLNEKLNNNLTVLYGDGESQGSQQNAKSLDELNIIKLITVKLNVKYRGIRYFTPIHLNTFSSLCKLKPDVIVCEGGKVNLLNIYISLIYSKLKKKPFILWVPGPLNNSKTIIKRIIDAMIEYPIKKSNVCIAYSTMAEDYLRKFKQEEEIFKAQNTIVIDKDKYNSNKYVDKIEEIKNNMNFKGKRVILFVGALEKRKNVDILIKAMRALDNTYKLIIIGDGTERKNLEKIAGENVHFLGRIVDDIEMYFKLCDIFILPGQGGVGINQAIAFGKPVICTRCDGTEKDLVNGNGYILDPICEEDIVKFIKKIFNQDGLYRKMSEISYNVDSNINYEAMIDNIVNSIDYSYKKMEGSYEKINI